MAITKKERDTVGILVILQDDLGNSSSIEAFVLKNMQQVGWKGEQDGQ